MRTDRLPCSKCDCKKCYNNDCSLRCAWCKEIVPLTECPNFKEKNNENN